VEKRRTGVHTKISYWLSADVIIGRKCRSILCCLKQLGWDSRNKKSHPFGWLL